MTKELICIVCPRGCRLTADIRGEQVSVTGNTCPRGEVYAVNEALHPVRTVTATVRAANRENTMIPVKTAAPIPKEQMMALMAALRTHTVCAPVSLGQVLFPLPLIHIFDPTTLCRYSHAVFS